ncbi:MAG TPA: hydroxymethylbilane synthase [Elusimicrobia bacterium]|jgi:hydroxymethylbilane synthase|nr:hydroxymethylbilane synthase [Elusimicrobiota bacterium]
MKKIIVGSRGSLLALKQSEIVIQEIKKFYPEKEFIIKKIKTKGDKIIDSPLSKIVTEPGGTKGLFTKEIEDALLRKEIDFAVHSMKDLPTDLPEGLCIGAIPKREKIYDVLLTKDGKKFAQLPSGGKIGTSSLRRKAQLLSLIPDLEIVDLRGNLNTRLRKLREQDLAGIIVAYAGLERMGYQERNDAEILNFLLPAVGQGAIGVEIRDKQRAKSKEQRDDEIREMVSKLNDEETATCIQAERAFLKRLGGGCQVPIGVKSTIVDKETLILEGIVLSPDGKRYFRDKVSGPLQNALDLGVNLAEKLITAGAKELLDLCN